MKRCAKVALTLLGPAMTAFGCSHSPPPREAQVPPTANECDVPKEPDANGNVPPKCPPPTNAPAQGVAASQPHNSTHHRTIYHHRYYDDRPWFSSRNSYGGTSPATTATPAVPVAATSSSQPVSSSVGSPGGVSRSSSSVSWGGFGRSGSSFSGGG